MSMVDQYVYLNSEGKAVVVGVGAEAWEGIPEGTQMFPLRITDKEMSFGLDEGEVCDRFYCLDADNRLRIIGPGVGSIEGIPLGTQLFPIRNRQVA
jgi:hypothetical protein